MKKKLSVIAGLILSISLVAGLALPGVVAADDDEDEALPQMNDVPCRVFKGEVIEKGDSFFVIQSDEQEPVTISVDGDTKYFKASTPRKLGALVRNRVTLRQLDCNGQEFAQQGIMQQGCADRVPWLTRTRTNAIPAPVQTGVVEFSAVPAPMQAGRARVNAAPVPVRAGMARGNAFSVPMPTESQELDSGLLTSGEEEGEPKRWQGKLEWLHCFGEEASFDDIAVGDMVWGWLSSDEDTSEAKLAEVIVIMKSAATENIRGTIEAVSDGSIIIVSDDESVTLGYDDDTRFIITLKGTIAVEQGQFAHAVYDGETMVAKLVRIRNSE